MASQPRPRPFLLFLSHPITGHLTPTLRVASALAARGWAAFFVGPSAHRARIERAGVNFLPLRGKADFDDLAYYSADNPHPPDPHYWSTTWQERALTDFRATWVETIPDEWASVVAALAHLQEREPGRQVIVVSEALFLGILPLFLGAAVLLPTLSTTPSGEGTNPPRIPTYHTIALSVTPPMIRSADVAPFGFGFREPYDPSPAGRERNADAHDAWAARTAALRDLLDAKLREAGAKEVLDGAFLTGQNYTAQEAILQLGVPSFFFPRSDWPPQFRFAGIIPAAKGPLPQGGWPDLPDWWGEIVDNTNEDGQQKKDREKKKKIVVVAQGTVEVDPRNLIIPTIEAMRDRPADEVLVVAILGRRGARLPPDVVATLPPNVRVADYLHYDAVLPHAAAWVHNAGYGAVQHGIAHGVPMVVAGEGQDKPENCKRIAWCGAGVDLGTSRPRAEDVRRGVEAVLGDPRYGEGLRCYVGRPRNWIASLWWKER